MNTGIPGLLAALALLGSLGAGDLILEVDAGARDRRDIPISLGLPGDSKPAITFCTLEALETGKLIPGQLHGGKLTWNLEAPMTAGSRRRYRLRPIPAPDTRQDLPPTVIGSPSSFKATANHFAFAGLPDVIPLKLDGRTIFAYHKAVTEPPAGIDPVYRRSGFVHPLATRSGVVVTDDFSPEHPHQHGLFTAWVNTTHDGRKVDFWNQLARTGRVGNDPDDPGPVFVAGPIRADFGAALRHDDLTAPGGPEKVLEERWRFTFHDIPGVVVLDFTSEQKGVGAKPLKINKYHYGGLGFRGSRRWSDPSAKGEDPPDPVKAGHVEFLTGEGKHRVDGNHTRPRWVDLSGEVDGKIAGAAVLDHPGNFRYPQPVRLHPNMPYFSFSPPVLGDFEIAPGQTYTSRYRLIVHDGRPDPALIERLWNDFADPPTVRIVEPD
jgi:Family of unknown function (DUF6807)